MCCNPIWRTTKLCVVSVGKHYTSVIYTVFGTHLWPGRAIITTLTTISLTDLDLTVYADFWLADMACGLSLLAPAIGLTTRRATLGLWLRVVPALGLGIRELRGRVCCLLTWSDRISSSDTATLAFGFVSSYFMENGFPTREILHKIGRRFLCKNLKLRNINLYNSQYSKFQRCKVHPKFTCEFDLRHLTLLGKRRLPLPFIRTKLNLILFILG